ncbi:MAG: hypothetical protein ACI8RD_014140, partial [Bacillariaceae sp.]
GINDDGTIHCHRHDGLYLLDVNSISEIWF